MKKRLDNKTFILFLYATSIMIFCIFYQNTNNVISISFSAIKSFVDDPIVSESLDNISKALQSFQVQFPIRILTGLLGIYLNSISLFLVFKGFSFVNKSKIRIPFYDITYSFYLTLYVSVLTNIILIIFMVLTSTSMDYHQNIYFIIFSLWNSILSSIIVIYYLYNKYGVMKLPIIYFSISLLILLFIKMGGYYEWNIF